MQTQLILDLGLLDMLHHTLTSPKQRLVKETCWTISNVTAGTTRQKQMVIDAGFLPTLERLLQGPADIAKEACWALSNLTSGCSVEQMEVAIRQGMFASLRHALIRGAFDVRVEGVALEGMLAMAQMAQRKGRDSDVAVVVASEAPLEGANPGEDAMGWLRTLVNSDSVEVSRKATDLTEALRGCPLRPADAAAVALAAVAGDEDDTPEGPFVFANTAAAAPAGADGKAGTQEKHNSA